MNGWLSVYFVQDVCEVNGWLNLDGSSLMLIWVFNANTEFMMDENISAYSPQEWSVFYHILS